LDLEYKISTSDGSTGTKTMQATAAMTYDYQFGFSKKIVYGTHEFASSVLTLENYDFVKLELRATSAPTYTNIVNVRLYGYYVEQPFVS